MDETTDLARTSSETIRLSAWRGVFERTNRIISGRPVNVKILRDVPYDMDDVLGWSDGETVYFNGPMVVSAMKSQSAVDAVLQLKGLNYHELSHILFTPRSTEEMPRRLKTQQKKEGDPHLWWSFNALEDQRIETLFSTTYGPSRRYFEAMILNWVLRNGTAEAAILVYGRKYLPAHIRSQAGDVFVQKYSADLYERFCKVIDAYSALVLPKESIKGISLVREYRALLAEMAAQNYFNLPPMPIEDNGMRGTDRTPSEGGPLRTGRMDREAAEEARERAAQQQKKKSAEAQSAEGADGDEAGTDSQPDAGTGKGGDTPDDSQDAAAGSAAGDADGDGAAADVDSSGIGNDSGDDEGGGSSGSGAGTASHEVMSEDDLAASMGKLMEDARSQMEGIREDEAIVSDADDMLDAVKAEVSKRLSQVEGVEARTRQTLTPLADSTLAVRKITQILRRLQQEAEPAILHRQHAGRIDIQRVVSRRPNEDDIFRAYDSGSEDDASMEAVILMDVSGSMQHLAVEASQAVWVLKRAFDKVDIRTTVMVYDTSHYVLYQPSDRAPARIQVVSTDGGTAPLSAIAQAQVLLKKSDRGNKLLVTVTDGGWAGRYYDAEALVKMMNKDGVVTMLLGLGNAVRQFGAHEHTLAEDLRTVRDLPKVVTKVVERLIRNATHA